MDCRTFKDLLDSYLSGELAVETNHACLHHAEQCSCCRAELGARRNLRSSLRAACQRTVMSAEATARLRARLQTEAGGAETAEVPAENVVPFKTRRVAGRRWFATSYIIPAAVAATLLFVLGGLGFYFLNRSGQPQLTRIAELSPVVMAEAASDHKMCAWHFADAQMAAITPAWMKEKYPAYAHLAEEAAPSAQELHLQLKAVHVCSFKDRKFGHLVYGQQGKLISLLVTARDEKCLRGGKVPADDGLTAGLQHAPSDAYQVSAYQTAKYVVLVVSEYSAAENQQLAAQLAAPVSAHLRQIEKSIACIPHHKTADFLASLPEHKDREGGRSQ